jgi:hypothetical protein
MLFMSIAKLAVFVFLPDLPEQLLNRIGLSSRRSYDPPYSCEVRAQCLCAALQLPAFSFMVGFNLFRK